MVILYIALGLLAALLAALALNTLRKCRRARPLAGEHPSPTPGELQKCESALGKMLRCRTVSVKDSYDDTEFAKLRQAVREEFPLLHKKAEYRQFSEDCWLYRLPGADQTRSILLMSHHDVVDVKEDWEHEPFGGQVVDGRIYGRGAADTKGSLCAILLAAERMLEAGGTPPVDLYIASSHNEELGGDGMEKLLAWFREQEITLEVILDEGGAIVEPPLAGMKCDMCAMVAVHEKGRHKLRFTAEAASSHVSLTGYADNPVERMAAFIREVTEKNRYIRRLNPQVKGMFEALGPYCGFPMNVLLCNLWLFGPLLQRVLPNLNATAGGMIGTTGNFQAVEGSVTGKSCTAELMLRHICEEDLQADMKIIEALAKKHGITWELTRHEYYGAADLQAPAYAYTMACLARIFPRFPAAPYILPAGTDAWRLSPVCSCVLRFAPTRMDKQQLGSIHAANENLDLAAIHEAAVFYRHFVENYK